MATTKEVIKEIQDLRGANVRIFGQPTTLPSDVDNYTIDIINLLTELKEYEFKESITKVDPSETNWETTEFDVVLDRLVEQGYIKSPNYYKGDNSYNWSSPVSNHFDFKAWNTSDGVIIALMVHRYGDVRGNYTDHLWYFFNSMDEFYECIYLTKTNLVELQGKHYYCDINVFEDYITVSRMEDNEQFTVYDYIETDKEMLQAIKDEIGFKTWLEQCHKLIEVIKAKAAQKGE